MLFLYGSTGLIINILFNSNNIMPNKQVIDDFYSSLGISKVKTKDKEIFLFKFVLQVLSV
jgi:hypothetical protein